jgi:hypothetical protein
MDRLESLGNTLSQITLYDIKTMYNQVSFLWRNLHSFVGDGLTDLAHFRRRMSYLMLVRWRQKLGMLRMMKRGLSLCFPIFHFALD